MMETVKTFIGIRTFAANGDKNRVWKLMWRDEGG